MPFHMHRPFGTQADQRGLAVRLLEGRKDSVSASPRETEPGCIPMTSSEPSELCRLDIETSNMVVAVGTIHWKGGDAVPVFTPQGSDIYISPRLGAYRGDVGQMPGMDLVPMQGT